MWVEEKTIIKDLVKQQQNYYRALDYINKVLNIVIVDKITNRDIIYFCLFNKSLCFYNLNKIDESLITLRESLSYAFTTYEFMKIDWMYGLCYENLDVELAVYYYDIAIEKCCCGKEPRDMINLGQIECTKAMLINDINLMESAVKIIIDENPSVDIKDVAYNSLCNIYIKNSKYINVFRILKKITDSKLKKILRNKILV